MENTVKERILTFIKYKKISVREFERMIDVSNGYVKALRKSPTADKMLSIIRTFPDINQDWLLTGDGDMLKSDESGKQEKSEVKTSTRPRLPVTVAAGMLSEYIGGIMAHQCEQMPIINNFPSYDFTMFVKGDSMEPKYEGGDEIACRKVDKVIEWGKAYVVDTNDGAFLKRIYDNGDSIKCVSYNSEYPDFNVEKTDIHGIYRVVGLLRL